MKVRPVIPECSSGVRCSVSPGAVALTAGLICLLLFIRTLYCDFVNFDDTDFVKSNLAIRHLDWSLLRYSFTKVESFNGLWIPLVWISFAIDYRLWELNPFGYHLTNLVLHAANTCLLVLAADELLGLAGYRQLFEKTGIKGWEYLYPATLLLAGLLWGIHPLRVESVAWVSERKDVLNGIFTFGAILFYLRYVRQKDLNETPNNRRFSYLISLALFLMSCMAKPTSVVIPVLLLAVDLYPLGRLRGETLRPVLLEKLPYLFISASITAITIYLGSQQEGLLISSGHFSLTQRAIVSGNAIFEYVRLILFPVGILPFHIIPDPIPASYAIKSAAVLGVTACACFLPLRRVLCPVWGSFVILLLPVLAFFQTTEVSVASRYVYIPSVVASIFAAVLFVRLYIWSAGQRFRLAPLIILCCFISILVVFGMTTVRLIGVWKDSGTMWTRVITYQPFDKAYFLRGVFYSDSGNYTAAIDDYSACLAIIAKEGMHEMYRANMLAFRGEAYTRAGLFDKALEDLSAAIEISPARQYFYFRGLALKGLGKPFEAQQDFDRAGYAYGQIQWVPF